MKSFSQRAISFEQDLLWSVLDQDALPDIIDMAGSYWGLSPDMAWNAIQRQEALGRLRAYRANDTFTSVDLAMATLDSVRQDFHIFVEPTEATHQRLDEIVGAVA